jgi:nuclear pore complex protein Nup188
VAYTALCDPDTASESTALRSFLGDEANLDILSSPWKPFAEPSAAEKTKFETKTAPISVTPPATAHYDLDEIKADSLWLSELARISQFAALRLVVIEWQSRPTVQLLSGLTEEEASSVQDATGLANLGASAFIPNSSIVTAPSASSDSQFDSENQRRLRIIDTYLSTRVSILRTSQLLVSWGKASDLRRRYGPEYRVCGDWLEQLGQDVAAKQSPTNSEALRQCIEALKSRCNTLDNGFTWNIDESIQEAAEERWATSLVTEFVHILHLATAHADLYTDKFVSATIVEQWFTFIAEKDFFKDLSLPFPNQQHIVPLLQLLTSLLCLSILKVDTVLDDLESGNYTSWELSSYTLNSTILELITNVFAYAKQLGPTAATPPAFAWAIITWRLTTAATSAEETRQAQIDNGHGSHASLSTPSPLEDAVVAIARFEGSELFDKKTPYQDLAESCSEFHVLDLVTQCVNMAMTAFGTKIDQISRDEFRFLLLQLIRSAMSSSIVDYAPELIVCVHAIMSGDRTFRQWVDNDENLHADPVTAFCLQDEIILRPLLIETARRRYPYEPIPFFQFCSALTRGERSIDDRLPVVASMLADMDTIMQQLPGGFTFYASIREEENANWVKLTQELPQFTIKARSSLRNTRKLLGARAHNGHEEFMTLPPGTEGNIVDDRAQPFVALWHYRHSAFDYLVTLLSTFVVGSNKVEYWNEKPVSPGTASEIIGLFADMLHSSLRASLGSEDRAICSAELLNALDIGADRTQDTVNIVLAIFEQGLLDQCKEPGNEESLQLLVNCVHFLQALLIIAPNRVWPWLTRSRLLEADGNGGSLASILIGTEMVLGRYDFLIGCIQLFQSLVDDAVGQSVARKTPSRALTRFDAPTTMESGTSDKLMGNLLLAFGRTLAGVYESTPSWRCVRVEDRLEINIAICETFTAILDYAYSVDDSPKLSSKLTGLVAPIAEYLVDLYISDSENTLPTNPILSSLLAGADVVRTSFMMKSAALWKRQTDTALIFANTLVRTAMLLNRPWTYLEQQLFKATPLLARLYANHESYKSNVLHLLESLVRGAVRVADEPASRRTGGLTTKTQTEPPSLLGHLGPRTAKNFLSILSQLDEPLKIIQIETQVWKLLSAVVTSKQQWFTLYLLTGSTPRDSVKNKDAAGSASRNKALLARALDSLSICGYERPDRDWSLDVAMLEFVSFAQNHWSWTMGDLRQRKDFIKRLLDFLQWLPRQSVDTRSAPAVLTRSYLNRFAALTCDILAMHLHTSRQTGDVAPLKDIVPRLTYMENNALQLLSYNVSLHRNLKKNFEQQFKGVRLASFKRTVLRPQPFGQNFFYDIDLGDKLLHFDNHWIGPRNQGFRSEVERANYNLSLVESQVQLLSSWKLLAIELSNVLTQDERLTKILTKVVRDCMLTNADSTLPEALFGQLSMVRADLSFVLIQRMVNAKIRTPEARQLLQPIWNAIRAATPDFDTIFSADAASNYRSLLRILYLALQFHLTDNSTSDSDVSFRSSFRGSLPANPTTLVEPISNQLLEVLADTVARGFRNLAMQLHSDPSTVFPSDFAILTAILQTILSIPEMQTWHAQAALLFSDSNTLRYATSLFSWSDRLTIDSPGAEKDPIYGELSLLFILSLSSMQPLAEAMAVEGILSQLNAANIMNFYRRPGGMGPFDKPARLFYIWTKGILPLCLNLLRAVGPAISGEISAFLNQFPEQLKRASNALTDRPSTKITLSVASEAHSLALISSILEGDRTQGPRLGIQSGEIPILDWEKEGVKEDIEGWLATRGKLRERIVAVDEGDARLFERKVGNGDDAMNGLEERVLREVESAAECLGVGAK